MKKRDAALWQYLFLQKKTSCSKNPNNLQIVGISKKGAGMLLYVDETENKEYFIVTGLLVNSREDAEHAYKSFKKKARKMPVSKRDKAKVFTEFKSTLLDRHYQKIKIKMIESVAEIDRHVIYSCYIKKNKAFPQNYKEDVYIAMLSKIVLSIEEDISIIFDAFNKQDFEERIIERISGYINVQAIMARDSQKEAGLQIVDNMCSIMRMHVSGTDTHDFYSMVEDWVQKV